MKEIKAFIHRNRISDVVHQLREAGFRNISVVDVLGLLKALDSQEQVYSIEIGDQVIAEVKLELVCEDKQLDAALTIIRNEGRTGQENAGWIYVTEILKAIPITGG